MIYSIPPLLSPFGDYPNPLHITDNDRASFHQVVKIPTKESSDGRLLPDFFVQDLTSPKPTRQLATDDERLAMKRGLGRPTGPDIPSRLGRSFKGPAIGRYDENRRGMYESVLFDDTTNTIDGYQGQRTVHIGIDLDGPVGEPVYAFCPGTICAVGYNELLGDYGNVIVIEHELPSQVCGDRRMIYALYGHLSDASICEKQTGQPVAAGEIVGWMGDIHENGGWLSPHVHFQLAIHRPSTHDMPGVVSMEDRPKALVEYPDPRYVLGPLY